MILDLVELRRVLPDHGARPMGIICLGLNLQWGQTGLFNVGVAGFVAIGAYASALLTDAATRRGRFGGFALPIAVGWLRRRWRRPGSLRSSSAR